jgi:hypothetical protein
VSEKLARNDIDNLGETRTARNRSVFRLQMQLWPCDSTRSGTIEANRSPKRRFRLISLGLGSQLPNTARRVLIAPPGFLPEDTSIPL